MMHYDKTISYYHYKIRQEHREMFVKSNRLILSKNEVTFQHIQDFYSAIVECFGHVEMPINHTSHECDFLRKSLTISIWHSLLF